MTIYTLGMKVSIVIPAKGSSERLPSKNLLTLGNASLVYAACEKCLDVSNIDNVYIDTESQDILDAVKPLIKRGLKVINRPAHMADNNTTGNDLIVFEQSMIEECDLLLHTYSTSPFITAETIENCISLFTSQDEYDSFFTALPVREYFWTDGKPLNFSLDSLPNSQDLDLLWVETHGLYGITWDALSRLKRRLGDKALPIEIPEYEALDINTQSDYDEASKRIRQSTQAAIR